MAYTPDTEVFRRLITLAVEAAGGRRVWAGIGAYRNTVEGTLEKIRVARELGVRGFILFSYDFAAHAPGAADGRNYLELVGERAADGLTRPAAR
jgi:dihydrodipicolinate synthase/N-acetylneuraminate lyase